MASSLVTAAFEQAVRDFKAELGDKALSDEISKCNSVEAVYDATDAIQKERGQRGLLRNLKKIEPFLDGLRSYAAVIEVFIQAKQDVLALIWGPVKLLLQWANALTQSMDAMINALADIGERLPEFQRARELFQENKLIEDVLPLFFRDLLDLYLIALKFFRKKYWQMAFESMWPKQREKISVVCDQIERHSSLLRREVTFEHIQGAIAAQKRALEHYEVSEASQRRQEYQAIKRDICPAEYGARLDFLDSHTCVGTGHWLAKNTDFVDWKQNTDKSQRALWIQGIPGAGKTFLCSKAIRELQTLSGTRILYAFLAYKSREEVSALSIFHSLVFQLASGDDDLQPTLCQSVQQSFKDSFDATAKVLQTLIYHAGSTYIVLDGLDEIKESERHRLLEKLLEIMGDCDDLRVLFSSRAESDIQKLLEGQRSIRVDKCNTDSIAAFVDHRTEQWLALHNFLPGVAADLRALLKPVASKAQGMFLYANVIFGIITELGDPDEVRAELRVLPENLNAAYARILSRINESNTLLKTKARSLLGWIGCSPIPLTRWELEQALVVSRQDADGNGRVVAVTDLVRTCGPIVEIVDDYVQFVHFTVQEYFFSSKVDGSISLQDATLDLACCCLTYLSQDHHDEDIGDQHIDEQLYCGAYRLHEFARTTWLKLIDLYIARNRDCLAPSRLVTAIETFQQRRTNVSCAPSNSASERTIRQDYKRFGPMICDCLHQAADFNDICSNDAFSRGKQLDWTDADPFTTSAFSARLFQHLNTILEKASTAPDQRKLIAWHYGNRPFKCGYVGCKYARHGFASRGGCKTHTKEHELKWFCSVEGCSYATGGFLSRSMRDNHLENYHTSTGPREMPYTYDRKDGDLMQLLYDFVALDDVAMIESLLPDFNRLKDDHKSEIRKFAVEHGSIAAYELIHDHLTAEILIASLSAGASHIFISLLSKYKVEYTKPQAYFSVELGNMVASAKVGVLTAILRSGSEEALEAWLSSTEVSEADLTRDPDSSVPSRIIKWVQPLIRATENHPARESMILRAWEMISLRKDSAAPNPLWLLIVARTTCSVRLVEWLLDRGVPVDYRTGKTSRTALYHAAQRTTQEAAGLMQFLLRQGADPEDEPDYQKRISDQLTENPKKPRFTISDGKGARNIKKWLGITWEELVTETRKERGQSEKLV